jgi:hypothetical protein
MLDYTNKEFVRSFTISNFKDDREISKEQVVNGRIYLAIGKKCATTVVIDLWKVFDPSVKSYKYVYLGGVAHQHPNDYAVKYQEGVEIAHERAMVEPSIVFETKEHMDFTRVEAIGRIYIASVPEQLLRTPQEVKLEKLNTKYISE